MNTFQSFRVGLALAALLGCVCGLPAEPLDPRGPGNALADRERTFEQNVGQFDSRTRFVLRGSAYHAFIQPDSVIYTWFERVEPDPADPRGRPSWNRDGAIRMTLDGADSGALVEGVGRGRRLHSYLSLDPAAPAGPRSLDFERVAARRAYPGIDVEYYLRGQQLEHDFIVAPGADPALIKMRIDGVDAIELTEDGDLLLVSGDHKLVQQAPFAYQGSKDEPLIVQSSYEVAKDGTVNYRLGDYDRSRPLVIDPIAWTTYLGGAGAEFPLDIKARAMGEAVITFLSNSATIPLTNEGELMPEGQSGPPDVALANVSGSVREHEELGSAPRYIVRGVYLIPPVIAGEPSENRDVAVADIELIDTLCRPAMSDDPAAPTSPSEPGTLAEYIAEGASLLLLAGAASGIPTIAGQAPQGRVDSFLAALLIPRNRRTQNGVPLSPEDKEGFFQEPEMIDFLRVGSDLNDSLTDLNIQEGCVDGKLQGFATGFGGDLTSFDTAAVNPIPDRVGAFALAFSIDTQVPLGISSDGLIEYESHTFFGPPNTRRVLASDVRKVDEERLVIWNVTTLGTGVNAVQVLTPTEFDPATSKFVQGLPVFIPLPDQYSEAEIVISEPYFLVAGANAFAAGTLDGLDPTNLGPIERIELPEVERVISLDENPAKPGEFIPMAIFATGGGPIDPASSGGIPPYGTVEQQMALVEGRVALSGGAVPLGAEGASGASTGPQITLVSTRVLGEGRNFVADIRLGGAYAIAGVTATEVFGPVDGLTPPEPILELSPNPGFGDLFAVGGHLEDDWVVVITGPASFQIEPLARNGIATGFTTGLAAEGQVAGAESLPLPNDLLGAVSTLIDAAGVEWRLGQFFVSSGQMNFHVPPEAARGVARIEIRTADGALKVGETVVVEVQPNAFVLGDGSGAALTILVKPDGTRTDTDTIATPEIEASIGDTLVFSQFVTGTSAGQLYTAICGGAGAAVLGAAAAPGLLGVEQVAIQPDLAAIGGFGPQRIACTIEVDGAVSNRFDIRYNLVQ